jgi:hypothetical protein
VLGVFLRDVIARNPETFRLFGPDETASNRLAPSSRSRTEPGRRSGCRRTTGSRRRTGAEVLSEHLCQGWLEGYLLTGRHGFFNCYEAFIHIVDSMFNQHAEVAEGDTRHPVASPLPSLNYLLSSHVWRQDHNGFSHQDPGFIDHVVNKKAEVIRVYLPARREHAALGRRPLPAQPPLRQRDRRRQAARARLPVDGRRDRALHARPRHLGLGLERRRRRAGRGHGLRRRRSNPRDARRGLDPARAAAPS